MQLPLKFTDIFPHPNKGGLCSKISISVPYSHLRLNSMPSLFQFAIPGNIKCLTSQQSEQMARMLSLTQHPCKITRDFFYSMAKTDTWIYNQNGLPAWEPECLQLGSQGPGAPWGNCVFSMLYRKFRPQQPNMLIMGETFDFAFGRLEVSSGLRHTGHAPAHILPRSCRLPPPP